MNGKVTYRQQYTRCGKQSCRKCKEGSGHGPYWYAYWSEKGRTVSKYIGAHLPEQLASSQELTDHTPGESDLHTEALLPPSPRLRVYLLGQFRIERNVEGAWRTEDSRTWHRRRARALLGCLLSSPGRRLGREQVMEMLWPDLDVDVAANRLNGAVHELRQILEPDIARPAASRLLRLEHDVLELADSSSIWVDAEAFEHLFKEAHTTSDIKRAEALLEEAAALYQGNYLLEELYAEWAAPRRDALQRAWISLLLELANLQIERHTDEQPTYLQAIDTLDRLRTADPTNETALQRLMILLTHLDRRGEALQIYVQHARMLKREYESDPLPETIKLYDGLRNGDVPAIPRTKQATVQSQLPPLPAQERQFQQPAPESTPQIFTFTRPTFQPRRHNQSRLIGRTHELDTMRQILHAIESGSWTKASTTSDQQQLSDHASNIPASALQPPPARSRFILLKGEPGIGKTRLAEEISLMAYTQGWAVAWSRSYEQEGTIPYRPWTELLRTLLQNATSLEDLTRLTSTATHTEDEMRDRSATNYLKAERLAPLLPELAGLHPPFLSSHTPSPAQHEQERLHLWEATFGLLSILSKTYPLLLIFDDLQWADDSSLELLIYLTHHLHNQRILLIGTCRDAELTPQHKLRTLLQDLQREQTITTITVHPLTHAQIGSLVSRQPHLPKALVESIQKQASGNPFFAEELARYLIGAPETDHGESLLLPLPEHSAINKYPLADISPKSAARPELSLPEAIAAVLERRLNKLSLDCQKLLERAAILGGSFTFSQLQSMANEDDEDKLLDLLEEALRAGLLTEEGVGAHITYHFWHPLIISHLYARLSAARRALLHRKAAEAIKVAHQATQQEKVAAAIAYHLGRGGGDAHEIAYYANLAGHQAYALTAYSEAQQYYLQAFRALIGSQPPHLEQSDMYTQIRAISLRDIERVSIEDSLHICRLLEYIAECSMVAGHFQEARHLYECILKIRTNTYAQRYMMQSASEQEQMQQQEAQIQALLWREIGNTWLYTGEYEQAYACNEHGRAIMSQAGLTSGMVWACLQIVQGEIFRLTGNYQAARYHLEEALAVLERIIQPVFFLETTPPDGPGSPGSALSSSYRASPEHSASNQSPVILYQERQTHTERALNGNPLEIGYAHERLGIVLASTGQFSTALQHMHTALHIYEQGELVSAMARICVNLGGVYLMRGENTTALNSMHRALHLAERTGDLPNKAFVMVNLGEVAHRSGNLPEAERWFLQGLSLCEQVNDRERLSWCYADLAGVQTDLGHFQEARENILHAITIGRAIKISRCIHHALVVLGELRVAEAIYSLLIVPTRQTPISHQEQWPESRAAHCFDSQAISQLYIPLNSPLLLRAKQTLQQALALVGMEIEATIEGQLALATAHFLLGELTEAYRLAYQTLQEAQGQELIRSVGAAYRLIGLILAAQANHAQAHDYFAQALQIFRERALHLDYARTLFCYSLALVKCCCDLSKASSIAASWERTEERTDNDKGLHTEVSRAPGNNLNEPSSFPSPSLAPTFDATSQSQQRDQHGIARYRQRCLACLQEALTIFTSSHAVTDLALTRQIITTIEAKTDEALSCYPGT
jgi:predicted ATPase/DNA-binding SARP family transcriptional activator